MVLLHFYLDPRSGVPVYVQLIQQVRHALRFGLLDVGDQLPTVKEVVAEVAVNPNTVLRAYRELELAGLVVSRPGLGTFIISSLDSRVPPGTHRKLRADAGRWVAAARAAGLDDEAIASLLAEVLRSQASEVA